MKLYDAYFRPVRGISQPEATRAYLLLERTGFALDSVYLRRQADRCLEDEANVLGKLAQFSSILPSEFQSDIDSVWSSPKKLTELFHTHLKLEPSPIFGKGAVARWKGEIKVDGVALRYLAACNPEYSELIGHLLWLKNVRSSKKYLLKLPEYINPIDGLVHPVYGPAKDDDESSGTKSGRAAMKNPEGHQIPSRAEKDPYLIRKGFIAPPGRILVVRDYQAMEAVLQHALCKALFNDDSLADATSDTFHAENARLVFGKFLKWKHNGKLISEYPLDEFKKDPYLRKLRGDIKTVFYGLQYRKGVFGFAHSLLDVNGRPIGEEIAGAIVGGLLAVRTGIGKYHEWVDDSLRLNCKRRDVMAGVPGFSGRWRDVSRLLETYAATGKEDWRFKKAGRQCANHALQEGGNTIKVTAMFEAQKRLKGTSGVVQKEIHDELVANCKPEDEKVVSDILEDVMENTYELPGGVKLKTAGASGENWYDAK